jgi:hypothetical protein
MSSFDLQSSSSISAPDLLGPPIPASPAEVQPDATPAEQAAAALVHLSGASDVTLAAFETSAPPNLAAASALVAEVSVRATGVSGAALGSLYTLMNPLTALALTSD